jgi:hypothetical protein
MDCGGRSFVLGAHEVQDWVQVREELRPRDEALLTEK